MRYSIVTLILVALTSTFALAASTDQLAATKHNFTTGTYNLGTGNICQPCHTPHHAITDDAISTRLWNHRMSSATYTLYDGSQAGFTGNVDGSQGMDRVSRLCLSCHDGTVALDAFGMGTTGIPGGNTGSLMLSATDTRNLGTSFADDHPVGSEALVFLPDGITPAHTPYRLKAPVLSNGRVSISGLSLASMAEGFVVGCRTCHNAHGTATGSANFSAHPKLLNTSEATLCTSCHYK